MKRKFLVAVRGGRERQGEIFSFTKKSNADSFVRALPRGTDYARSTYKDKR